MANSPLNILDALKSGRFEGIPANQLEARFLASPRLTVGQSYLHFAAIHGTLHRIPGLILDRRLLTLRDRSGRTVLHIAALNRTLHLIPQELLNDSDFRLKDSIGRTVYEIAKGAGCPNEFLEDVVNPWESRTFSRPASVQHEQNAPPSSLRHATPPDPFLQSILLSISGTSPLPKDITQNDLIKTIPGDQSGTTLIHVAAGKGALSKFPLGLLTAELMLATDNSGRTPLHRAINRKAFDKVPIHLCNQETLSATDNNGVSVIDLLINKGLTDLLPDALLLTIPRFAEEQLLMAFEAEDFLAPVFNNSGFLATSPSGFEFDGTWYHWLASNGYLGSLPPDILEDSVLILRDSQGRSPLHVSVANFGATNLPGSWNSVEYFLTPDSKGRTPFHELASLEELGGAPTDIFTRDVLITRDLGGNSVADVIEEYGNTELLPPTLRHLSLSKALEWIDLELKNRFSSAENVWRDQLSLVIAWEEFNHRRNQFVRDWSRTYFRHALDEEQAEAVIAAGRDLLVSARAGSGKTGTLVARALFEMEKRGADPRKIVILAFNKKAAREVRERLSKITGEDRCPHVMTFHSLAYRLVHPEKDSILMDERDSEEGEALSQGLNNLIDDEVRNGKLVEEIKTIMKFRWEAEWDEMVKAGGLLSWNDALPFREARQFHGIDGRFFENAMEKVVADELVRRGKDYYHRSVVFRRSGNRYTPAFSVPEGGRKVIIDIAGTADPGSLQAGEFFWKGDKSSAAVRIELPSAESCGDIDDFRKLLISKLEEDDLGWKQLGDEQIWNRIKERAITNFARAAVTFIGRCQKELWTPELLEERIEPHLRVLEELEPDDLPDLRACVKFWQVCHRLHRSYLKVLSDSRKTDFDHLMMDASRKIRESKTAFQSMWSSGNLATVEHVFIDEYQDFSHLFNELRESIQSINLNVRFFCVGDDWQAINGFAGSNLRYFHGFSEMFPDSHKLEILKNYRSAPEVVNLGNRVMEGLGSPSIPALSMSGTVCQIFAESESNGNDEWGECVEDQLGPKAIPLLKLISQSMREGKTLLVLFRNRTVWTSSKSLKLQQFRKELFSWFTEDPKDRLVFSTTHSYKGGEADHVVLVDPEDYPLIHEDHIFNLIFGENEKTLTDDERRLFYVGVTRAKERLVFLRDNITRIQQGKPVAILIPFLSKERLNTDTLVKVESPIDPGERCLVRVTCGSTTLGTEIRKSGFTYFSERNVWRKLIGQGSPRNRFECKEFLASLKWLEKLSGWRVEFVWKDRIEAFAQALSIAPISPQPPQDQPHKASTTTHASRSQDSSKENAPVNRPVIGGQWVQIPGWTGHTTAEEKRITASGRHPAPDRTAQAARPDESSSKPETARSTADGGVFHTGVVGTKYGNLDKAMLLNAGDFVQLVREPSNPHDRHAIKVNAPCGKKIGYISRHVASHLAKGLDAWGGVSQAKVTSVWKQPHPHTHVSIDICFPLPPGVVIPVELDHVAQMEDSPFDSPRKPPQVSSTVMKQAPSTADCIPTHQGGKPVSAAQNQSTLSAAECEELDLIADVHLRDLIATLAIEQSIPFPTVGFDGGTGDVADGSMLEVAWPDYKIGIAIPENQIGTFERRQWTIFRSETVSPNALRQAFGTSIDFNDDVAPPIDLDDEFKKFETHHPSGTAFEIDDEPDDDIPY
jgi:DNA helicase-4